MRRKGLAGWALKLLDCAEIWVWYQDTKHRAGMLHATDAVKQCHRHLDSLRDFKTPPKTP